MMVVGLASFPILRATCSRSTSVVSSVASTAPLSVTKATICCPVVSSTLPMHAASATSWWSTRADSTSVVEIRWPEMFMTSSTRPSSQK